jgi:hypothetical protein
MKVAITEHYQSHSHIKACHSSHTPPIWTTQPQSAEGKEQYKQKRRLTELNILSLNYVSYVDCDKLQNTWTTAKATVSLMLLKHVASFDVQYLIKWTHHNSCRAPWMGFSQHPPPTPRQVLATLERNDEKYTLSS